MKHGASMGAFVEPALVKGLQDDIQILCQKLEECDYESLVVIMCKRNEYSHITGSRGGRDFLEDKQPFISDFRKYCSGANTLSELPQDSKKSATTEERIPVYDSPKLSITNDNLNTPLVPNNDYSDMFDDDTDDYNDTQFFDPVTIADNFEYVAEKVTSKNDILEQSRQEQSKESGIGDKTEKVVVKETRTFRRKMNFVTHREENVGYSDRVQSDIGSGQAHKCYLCKKIFSTLNFLRDHIKDSHAVARKECQECHKTFESSLALGDHIDKNHRLAAWDQDGYYRCDLCRFVFCFKTHLLEHNQRNLICKNNSSAEGSTNHNKDNILQSEISFAVAGEIKIKTLKELLDNKENPNTCEICQKSFEKPYSFRRHILQHSSVKPYTCNICCTEFNMEENLKRHWKLHDTKPHYCENCFERYESLRRLKHHVKISCKKTPVKPDLQCTLCEQQCASKSALETHLKVHTGVKEWECSTCSRKVISKEALWRHNQVFHQDEKPYECTECGRKFKCRDHLKKHSTKHGERQYKCEICDYAAFENGHLKKHMRTHTKDMPFVCDYCGKRYARKFYLDNHRRLHTGERPYQCDFEGCDKAFRNPLNLKQHKFYHAKSYACICDVCGKQFKVPSAYRNHRKIHMVDFRWPCDYCEDKFKSLMRYKTHIMNAHKEMTKEIESKKNIRFYQCNLCPKMFAVKDHFGEHMNSHMGLKPNKCRFCGKGFCSRGNMLQHEKGHTGGKKISCSYCTKRYNDVEMFKQHMEAKHPNKAPFESDQDNNHVAKRRKTSDDTAKPIQIGPLLIDAATSLHPEFQDFMRIQDHFKLNDV